MESDGRCVLIARWNIPAVPEQSGGATIVTNAPVSGGVIADEAIVTAMTNAIGQLADRIAGELVWPPVHPRSNRAGHGD